MRRSKKLSIKQLVYNTAVWMKVVLFLISGWFPIVLNVQTASAAQLTSRSLTMSTSRAGATGTTHGFNFNIATTSNVGSMEFEYCTAPLGTCTAPTGLNTTAATISGNVTINAVNGAFTVGTNTTNKIQITRTAAATTAGHAVVATFANITNPDPAGANENASFYVRVTTYATAAYTTSVDTGVVAGATANQLTVNARVEERLDFCVGTTTVDNATTSVGADCAAISGNTVDLGVIDASTVAYTPVVAGSGGNAVNGVAMIRTNAFNGAIISYFAEQNTSSGKLKVAGATCSGTSTTDQCFNSAGSAQNAIAAGTEEFGMTVAGVNCGSSTAYTCTFSSGAYNLVRDLEYDGGGSNTYQATSGNNWAWTDTGTTDVIASSAGSAVKVIDDEALILKFAATAAITTPTGQYTVTSTYIATATF